MKVDDALKFYGKSNKVPISLDDTLNFLCEQINKSNAKSILEIGTAIGYSAITMAENTNLQHIDTIEIDNNNFLISQQNINNHNLQNVITAYNMDAMDYIKSCTKTYDLIYLDGPKGQYINYLPYLINLLKVGGILIADNLYFHGMVTGKIEISKGCRAMIKGLKNYIQAIKNNPQLKTEIKDIGDGLGFSTKIK